MTSKILRLGIAFAVIVALIGAVGLVSADMHSTNTDDDERPGMAGMADQMPGGMADHMDGNMMEQMHEHMGDHDHEAHHEGAHDHETYHDGAQGHC